MPYEVVTSKQSINLLDYAGLSDTAYECGVAPKVLSDWLYNGKLDRERTVRVAGRTLFPRSYVEAVIKPLLRKAGYSVSEKAVQHA